MKRALILIALAALICACKNTPQKISDFVDNVEQNCENYSEEEWETANQKYDKLIEELEQSDKNYSDAERQMAFRAIGKYHALLAKKYVSEGSDAVKSFFNALPGYFDGLTEGLANENEKIEEIFDEYDEEKLKDALDSLTSEMKRTGEVFNQKATEIAESLFD